jgi:hypothetical protein
MGAGIGGLACAHTLAEHGLEVHVIERHDRVGGLARTNTFAEYSDVCWKAVSSGYHYLLQILSEVRDGDGCPLIARLRPLEHFIYAMEKANYTEDVNSFITKPDLFLTGFKKLYGQSVPVADIIKLSWLLFKVRMCPESMFSNMVLEADNQRWADYVASMSPLVQRWVLDSTAIYLGMDYQKISTGFIMQLLRDASRSKLVDSRYVFYSFDGPLQDVFLEPWKQSLERRGVIFHLNTHVQQLNIHDNRITSIIVSNSDLISVMDGDVFVNCMNCQELARLHSVPQYKELALLGSQLQTQVLYELPHKTIDVLKKPTILIMPDTPWFLMTRMEETLFVNDNVFLSAGIGIWDRPGHNGKTAMECDLQELADECWRQMTTCQHNLRLPVATPKWNVWHGFSYSDDEKKIVSVDLKFSNNVGTLQLRPSNKDEYFFNLYHATAYTRTKMNIYNMESAAEAGVCTGKMILSVHST